MTRKMTNGQRKESRTRKAPVRYKYAHFVRDLASYKINKNSNIHIYTYIHGNMVSKPKIRDVRMYIKIYIYTYIYSLYTCMYIIHLYEKMREKIKTI